MLGEYDLLGPLEGVSGLIVGLSAALYDGPVWVMTWGRARAFREKLLRFARLQPGETVLDVGCGTGSLAIAAKMQAGPAGKVYGIDASPEMLARARKKARKAGVEVTFEQAPGRRCLFPTGTSTRS